MAPSITFRLIRSFAVAGVAALVSFWISANLTQAMAAEACSCFTAEDAASCDIAPGAPGPNFTVLGDYAGDDMRLVAICGDLRAEYPLYSIPAGSSGCGNFSGNLGYVDASKAQAMSCVSLLGDEWMKRNR